MEWHRYNEQRVSRITPNAHSRGSHHMGVIADSLIEYCKPLMEPTDGSPADLQKALHLGQLCWNLAILPDAERGPAIAELQSSMTLDDVMF